MKKLMMLLLTVCLVLSATLAVADDIKMVAMKSVGNNEYIIWESENKIALYALVKMPEMKLVKIKDLDPNEYKLNSPIRPKE